MLEPHPGSPNDSFSSWYRRKQQNTWSFGTVFRPRLDYFLLRTQLSVLSFPLFFAICWDSLSGGRLIRGQPTALLSHNSSHHLMISGHVLQILSYLTSWLFHLLAPLHATRKREAIKCGSSPLSTATLQEQHVPVLPSFLERQQCRWLVRKSFARSHQRWCSCLSDVSNLQSHPRN